MPKGSVKIMRSYDYSHFEICLGSDEELSLDKIDSMRKEAARLVDKAVKQYQVAKSRIPYESGHSKLKKKVKIIRENYPKSEWTPEQKAMVKALDDFTYYDYQDDWEDQEDQDY